MALAAERRADRERLEKATHLSKELLTLDPSVVAVVVTDHEGNVLALEANVSLPHRQNAMQSELVDQSWLFGMILTGIGERAMPILGELQ
jgi:hypothetical protein